jgi:hypothetical protein
VKHLAPDVLDLFRAVNLAQQRVGVLDQAWLPPPYVEASLMVIREQNLVNAENAAERARNKSHGS